MNSDFKYQQIIKNNLNYLDPLVWRTGLAPYDNLKGPDRKVGYGVQNTTDDYIFRRALPVDLSIDYDLKFYTKKIGSNTARRVSKTSNFKWSSKYHPYLNLNCKARSSYG